jgi:hypothetical protein
MPTTPRRNGFVLVAFVVTMFVIISLAFSSTTWAAPGAQGTVPTPPAPTDAPTDSGSDNGGGDNDNNGDTNPTSTPPTSTPSPVIPTSGTVCAIGETGAQCSSGDLIIVVGTGAASAGSALSIEGSFKQPPCPASPAGQIFLNRCYRFTWIDSNAQPLSTIKAPVQYCIGYGPEQLAAVKNQASALLIGLAGADGNWTLLKPTLDSTGGRTCATSNQAVVWSALFAPQSASELLPTVGGQSNLLWIPLMIGVGVVLLLGAAQVRRKAK